MSTRRRRSADQHGGGYALELVDVSKVYEVGGMALVALDHVDLAVAYNEVVTLLGPSGSGKTTLLSIAGGLLTATEGRVVVDGRDITNASSRKLTAFRRKEVGFIFQSVNLVPFLTARENLLVVSELAGRERGEARRRADQLLEELGLGHRMANLPAQLSGGERQRVAIGRALMNEPALVLVDEPTSALDSDLGQQVMELIVSEVKARGAAAVIVTHDQRMTRYGDRVLQMADGMIAEMAPRSEWITSRRAERADRASAEMPAARAMPEPRVAGDGSRGPAPMRRAAAPGGRSPVRPGGPGPGLGGPGPGLGGPGPGRGGPGPGLGGPGPGLGGSGPGSGGPGRPGYGRPGGPSRVMPAGPPTGERGMRAVPPAARQPAPQPMPGPPGGADDEPGVDVWADFGQVAPPRPPRVDPAEVARAAIAGTDLPAITTPPETRGPRPGAPSSPTSRRGPQGPGVGGRPDPRRSQPGGRPGAGAPPGTPAAPVPAGPGARPEFSASSPSSRRGAPPRPPERRRPPGEGPGPGLGGPPPRPVPGGAGGPERYGSLPEVRPGAGDESVRPYMTGPNPVLPRRQPGRSGFPGERGTDRGPGQGRDTGDDPGTPGRPPSPEALDRSARPGVPGARRPVGPASGPSGVARSTGPGAPGRGASRRSGPPDASPTSGRRPLPRRSPGRGYVGPDEDAGPARARPPLPRRVPGPGGHPGQLGPASGGRLGSGAARPAYETGPQPAARGPYDTGSQSPAGRSYDTDPQPPARGSHDTGPPPAARGPYDTGSQRTARGSYETGPQPPARGSYDTGPQPPARGSYDSGPQPAARGSYDSGPQPPASGPYDSGPQPPVAGRDPYAGLPGPQEGSGDPAVGDQGREPSRRRRRRNDDDPGEGDGFWPERWRD